MYTNNKDLFIFSKYKHTHTQTHLSTTTKNKWLMGKGEHPQHLICIAQPYEFVLIQSGKVNAMYQLMGQTFGFCLIGFELKTDGFCRSRC